MVGHPVYVLSIVFALVAGTAAGIFALLSWEILRSSPVGQGIFTLVVLQIVFIVYHILVLITPEAIALQHLIHSVMYTMVALLVWWLVWVERRIQTDADPDVRSS